MAPEAQRFATWESLLRSDSVHWELNSMQAPPPYYAEPPKKSRTGLIVGLIIGAFCLCCALPMAFLVGAGFWGLNKLKGRVACGSTTQTIQRSLIAYAHDHNDKLPDAAKWQDELRGYYAKEIGSGDYNPLFKPSNPDGDWTCTNDDGQETGFAFNNDCSAKKTASLKDQLHTFVVFEMEQPGKNQHRAYKPMSSSTSPKVLGRRKGWFVASLEGGAMLDEDGRLTSFRIDKSNIEMGNLASPE